MINVEDETEQDTTNTTVSSLTADLISKLRFRDLRKELEARELDTFGTTAQLRDRLRALGREDEMPEECELPDESQPVPEDCETALQDLVDFVDESDPDFEYKELVQEIYEKSDMGHWKAATRKLKRLSRRFALTHTIPEDVYTRTLDACMKNRMQGARASEPARKILEQMVELGHAVPEAAGNYCIRNSIGDDFGPDSTHQGFGGLDTALAMKMAMEMAGVPLQPETREKLAVALARAGSVDESMAILRKMVVEDKEELYTPSLATFGEIGMATTQSHLAESAKEIPNLLAYAKAAGYELDTIAETEDGCKLLASGVVAADRLQNVALGLRLLTAAAKTKGGDTQVSTLSSVAQRASTRIHQRAINQAVADKQWQLACKVLALMLERKLRPSEWVWRKVVTCCAKQEKSRKATALLQDWVKLYEDKKADQPPVSVFNTCMNVCEICGEEELTLVVLESMKKTHQTDGNLITFNIALKRLAKQGNALACEGIIVGMLQAGVEPSVVSYTTAIAACANIENKDAPTAFEWLKRMRSRLVRPNVLTYNTALAACLDGSVESAVLASQMAGDMMVDVAQQLADDSDTAYDRYTNVLPDASTKILAREAIDQLEKNWKEDTAALDKARAPLLQLAEFEKPEVAPKPQQREETDHGDEGEVDETQQSELELEFSAASSTHRIAEV